MEKALLIVVPARAGMIPLLQAKAQLEIGSPRASGDDPETKAEVKAAQK